MTDQGVLLVFSDPVPGREEEFDRWYDEVHVPEVLAVPGVVAAQRYRLSELEQPEVDGIPSPAPPAHRFLVVYDLDRDPQAVMDDFVAQVTSGTMDLSDALDLASVGLSTWAPHGPRKTSA